MLAQVRLIEVLRRSIQRQESQLRASLLRVFPQAIELFGSLTAQITLEFLMAYPTAQEAQRLSAHAFKDFCRTQHYPRPDLVPQRYAHLLQPAPCANPAVVEAYRSHVSILADLLLRQVRQRNATLAHLQQLFEQHPDQAIFASLPGAGDLLAPALLVKFGDHRQRFPSPAAVQALAGTCPVTQQSGKRRQIKFRRGCDKEFRRIAQQFAQASISQSGWASAYYHDVRTHSASDSHAYRCLANRWLAIIWKLWQKRIPYDEELHLRQRNQRQQPLP
jgi:transposase